MESGFHDGYTKSRDTYLMSKDEIPGDNWRYCTNPSHTLQIASAMEERQWARVFSMRDHIAKMTRTDPEEIDIYEAIKLVPPIIISVQRVLRDREKTIQADSLLICACGSYAYLNRIDGKPTLHCKACNLPWVINVEKQSHVEKEMWEAAKTEGFVKETARKWVKNPERPLAFQDEKLRKQAADEIQVYETVRKDQARDSESKTAKTRAEPARYERKPRDKARSPSRRRRTRSSSSSSGAR